jgi:hypothetical protein
MLPAQPGPRPKTAAGTALEVPEVPEPAAIGESANLDCQAFTIKNWVKYFLHSDFPYYKGLCTLDP